MNVELDLEGHGIGKLFAILARRQAAKAVPVDHEKFKRAARKPRRAGGFELTPWRTPPGRWASQPNYADALLILLVFGQRRRGRDRVDEPRLGWC
jgi:hypothetical protein